MDIKKALQLKVGQTVSCPPDRGNKGYRGTVEWFGMEIHENIHHEKYIWVTVKGPDHSSFWPSNRIGG